MAKKPAARTRGLTRESRSAAVAPRPGAPAGDRAPFTVPVFTVGHALLRHASIEVFDPGGLGHLEVADVTLDLLPSFVGEAMASPLAVSESESQP